MPLAVGMRKMDLAGLCYVCRFQRAISLWVAGHQHICIQTSDASEVRQATRWAADAALAVQSSTPATAPAQQPNALS